MARQTGLFKIKGTLDNVSFYKSKDGMLARMKTSIDATRIRTDDRFVRTRENGSEFGTSAKAGKLVRDSVRSLMLLASDGRVTARMTKVMTQIKNLDTVSNRGERNITQGLTDPAAAALLKGFNFNNRALIGSVLYKSFSVDTSSGVITINGFNAINDITCPPGATHVSFRSAMSTVDFDTNEFEFSESNIENIHIVPGTTSIVLTPTAPPSVPGTKLFFLLIEFFQKVNGQQYSLKNGAYNVLTLVEVA